MGRMYASNRNGSIAAWVCECKVNGGSYLQENLANIFISYCFAAAILGVLLLSYSYLKIIKQTVYGERPRPRIHGPVHVRIIDLVVHWHRPNHCLMMVSIHNKSTEING